MSQKLGSSLLKQASERHISSLRWAPGATFRNPWKPDPPCLSGFLFMTLSLVGSHELAFLKPLKTWSALPIRFSPSWPCHGWDLMCRLLAPTLASHFQTYWRASPAVPRRPHYVHNKSFHSLLVQCVALPFATFRLNFGWVLIQFPMDQPQTKFECCLFDALLQIDAFVPFEINSSSERHGISFFVIVLIQFSPKLWKSYEQDRI